MSTKLSRNGTSGRLSSVPVDDIYDLVRQLIPGVERQTHGFSFRGRLGTTHLHVRPVDHRSKDGLRITDVVTVNTNRPNW